MLNRVPTIRQPILAWLCVCFVFAVSLANLKTYPIINDEFRTLNHIEPVWSTHILTLAETIQSVSIRSPQHGPAYFFILNIWHKLAGFDLFSLRLLSTMFAALSIAVMYQLARISGAREDQTAAAIALSFLAFYLFHAHYLRMYTLLASACGCFLLSYWRVSAGQAPSRLAWVALFASTALLPYIHYMGSVLPAAAVIYHLLIADRGARWWRVLLLMTAAGLCFLPWLPVVMGGVSGHLGDENAIRLDLIGALRAVSSVLSNGILFLPLLVAGLALAQRKQLNSAEKYIALVTALAAILLILINIFAPVFIENRMRYAIVLAVPFCCLAVICLRRLPSWHNLRWLALILWCLSFFLYLRSEDYAVYTNSAQHETKKIPNYQTFIYNAHNLPGHNDLILSFHPRMRLSSNKTLPYYRKILPRWQHIAHISYDDEGEVFLQSGHFRYDSLPAIAANSRSVWLLHNPAETDLDALPVYTGWFTAHFKMCQRFHESATAIIDLYLSKPIPCELITDETPLSVHYDNGMILANALVEPSPADLRVYLWWHETFDDDWSLSLQVFDDQMQKARQLDAVIAEQPIDEFSFDLDGLAPGAYELQLIVYNFETLTSVPGSLVNSQTRFEYSATLASFALDD